MENILSGVRLEPGRAKQTKYHGACLLPRRRPGVSLGLTHFTEIHLHCVIR